MYHFKPSCLVEMNRDRVSILLQHHHKLVLSWNVSVGAAELCERVYCLQRFAVSPSMRSVAVYDTYISTCLQPWPYKLSGGRVVDINTLFYPAVATVFYPLYSFLSASSFSLLSSKYFTVFYQLHILESFISFIF